MGHARIQSAVFRASQIEGLDSTFNLLPKISKLSCNKHFEETTVQHPLEHISVDENLQH